MTWLVLHGCQASADGALLAAAYVDGAVTAIDAGALLPCPRSYTMLNLLLKRLNR